MKTWRILFKELIGWGLQHHCYTPRPLITPVFAVSLRCACVCNIFNIWTGLGCPRGLWVYSADHLIVVQSETFVSCYPLSLSFLTSCQLSKQNAPSWSKKQLKKKSVTVHHTPGHGRLSQSSVSSPVANLVCLLFGREQRERSEPESATTFCLQRLRLLWTD